MLLRRHRRFIRSSLASECSLNDDLTKLYVTNNGMPCGATSRDLCPSGGVDPVGGFDLGLIG